MWLVSGGTVGRRVPSSSLRIALKLKSENQCHRPIGKSLYVGMKCNHFGIIARRSRNFSENSRKIGTFMVSSEEMRSLEEASF